MNILQGQLYKFYRLREIIKFHGGFKKFMLEIFYTDDAKMGRLVGQDCMGNKYYESSYYFVPRDRWVIYSKSVGLNYDASMIAPEWFGWLHHMTDYLPSENPNRPYYPWLSGHCPNFTGTRWQFYPYSTTKPKIEVWKPPPPQYATCL